MQLLMIRHSYAAEPGSVVGGDFERPLTERGQQVFSHMAMWLVARGMVSEDDAQAMAAEMAYGLAKRTYRL